MSQFMFILCAIVIWCAARTTSESTTVKYTYNSSDLSYLSNGIQFPVAESYVQALVMENDQEIVPEMQWLSGLYDHFNWRTHLNKLENEKCLEDMTTYLNELSNANSWAIKMYDASGRYPGQFFFGNDYWLGSQSLCTELTNTKTNSELPPFPVYFYVAKIRININRKATPVTRQLNVGECLPRSCGVVGVRMLLARERSQGASINIVGVREVPGEYSLLSDLKVHIVGGLLLTLTFFRSESKKDKSSRTTDSCQTIKMSTSKFLVMIVYRFFRLTPAYLFVLGVNEIILRYLHNSSVFSPAIIDHITCAKYWWRNALYINNFYPQHEFCMLWSWYVANDTQFYIIATILLLVAVRGPKQIKFVAVSIGVLMLASWIATFVIAMKWDYVARVEEPFALFDQLYDKPWLRIGSYLIGIMVGYMLFRVDCKISMSPIVVTVGWILSLACLGSLVYGLGREGLVVPASAFYAALGHTAWGLSVAWITVACCVGYGGPINTFLSCKLFLPFSRLTYCAYLIHPVLMCITSFVLDGSLHLHNYMIIVIFSGNVVLSFLSAFAISLAFEAPVVNLLKIIFA